MKFKLLIILLVLFGTMFITYKNEYKHKETNKEQITVKETIESEVINNESNIEPITENIKDNKQDNNKTSGTSSDSTSTTNKYDKKSNTNINSNVVKEKDVENNSTQVENDSTVRVEKQNPWDDLGITEYDYYNKPMWSWARVDYSIKEYKTQELAQQKCIEDGNNMLDEILSFSCTTINSYSGDYLGEMLRVKY